MITELDASTALVIIDLQRGTLANPMSSPVEPIVARANELAEAFRRAGCPVAIATAADMPHGRNDYGSGGRELIPGWDELAPSIRVAPTDIRIAKTAWSAFSGTPLDAQLRQRNITGVVIVGLATSFGIESTARGAFDLGYNVTLPTDVMTDMRAESHEHSVARVFPVIAQTGSSSDVLHLLQARLA